MAIFDSFTLYCQLLCLLLLFARVLSARQRTAGQRERKKKRGREHGLGEEEETLPYSSNGGRMSTHTLQSLRRGGVRSGYALLNFIHCNKNLLYTNSYGAVY